jgi:hypothetical protein
LALIFFATALLSLFVSASGWVSSGGAAGGAKIEATLMRMGGGRGLFGSTGIACVRNGLASGAGALLIAGSIVGERRRWTSPLAGGKGEGKRQ